MTKRLFYPPDVRGLYTPLLGVGPTRGQQVRQHPLHLHPGSPTTRRVGAPPRAGRPTRRREADTHPGVHRRTGRTHVGRQRAHELPSAPHVLQLARVGRGNRPHPDGPREAADRPGEASPGHHRPERQDSVRLVPRQGLRLPTRHGDHPRPVRHGRTTRGPPFVAGDTNLLIDYFNFGRLLWEDDNLPDSIGGDYASELEGLQLVMELWVIRDIRFVILRETINDAKRKISEDRRSARLNALREFTSALWLVSTEAGIEAQSREGLLILPDSELEREVQHVAAGFDRNLVRSAARMGIHVFLTNDKGILKQRTILDRSVCFSPRRLT